MINNSNYKHILILHDKSTNSYLYRIENTNNNVIVYQQNDTYFEVFKNIGKSYVTTGKLKLDNTNKLNEYIKYIDDI